MHKVLLKATLYFFYSYGKILARRLQSTEASKISKLQNLFGEVRKFKVLSAKYNSDDSHS